MLADTGLLLETIDYHSLTAAADRDKPISLTDYEFLSSYNWVDDDAPVIYVPGGPPVWNPRETPFRAAKDQGTYFVDQNTARCATYPAEALFRSLAVMQPSLSMGDFDLVTDRNCLRKLLRFVFGDVDQSFRIDVQLQSGVMFLCRWETELKRIILGHENFGYGHSFEKTTTNFEKELQDSSGHHRVVRYNLGSFRCLVRYEADGCTEDFGEPADKEKTKPEEGDGADDLLDALKSMSIASPRVEATGSVQVLSKGRVVSPSTIIEIKTRAIHRKLRLNEVIPQLWFAQTPTLFVGYHKNGLFQEVQKTSMKSEFECWEKQHQAQLSKLVNLLKKLKDSVRITKNERCIVVCEGKKTSARMRVYESNRTGGVLPDDIINLHKVAAEKVENGTEGVTE